MKGRRRAGLPLAFQMMVMLIRESGGERKAESSNPASPYEIWMPKINPVSQCARHWLIIGVPVPLQQMDAW